MIVLDTNVLSELIGSERNLVVRAWIREQSFDSLYTTSISMAEIFYGIAVLPEGKRKERLLVSANGLFSRGFARRIFAFGRTSALHYADITAGRRKAGRPIGQLDAQIAAISRSRGAAVATRNVTDFTECGVEVINPWEG